MKQRCLNPNNKDYPDYGGRGIGIYPDYRDDFLALYADMLDPAPGLSIDRIDVKDRQRSQVLADQGTGSLRPR
jgi:hypothetical protein